MSREFLKLAIESAGGQAALAHKLGGSIRQPHIWAWLNKTADGVPEKQVIPISAITNWEITPHQLRPDIYPHPNDGLPESLRTELAA